MTVRPLEKQVNIKAASRLPFSWLIDFARFAACATCVLVSTEDLARLFKGDLPVDCKGKLNMMVSICACQCCMLGLASFIVSLELLPSR